MSFISLIPDFLVPLILDRAEAEFHIVVLNPNDFKEPVEFQAFLKYLLYLTLLVNEAADNLQAAIEAKPDFFGLFSTMFTIFLGNVVYTVKPFSSGTFLAKCFAILSFFNLPPTSFKGS